MNAAPGIVMRPQGELDVATVGAFRQNVQHALAAEPAALLFDLADLTFIDSSGLGVLALALRTQRAKGLAAAVVNPQPIVSKAIALVGLEALLETDDIPPELLEPAG